MTYWVGAVITIGIFLAGSIWNAARAFERLNRLRLDLDRLERMVTRDLGELKALLYTTIGGRRAIRPIEVADEPPREHPP